MPVLPSAHVGRNTWRWRRALRRAGAYLTHPEHARARYLLATGLAALTVLLSILLAGVLDGLVFALSLVIIGLTALAAGTGPGLLACLLVTGGIGFFAVEPRYQLFTLNQPDAKRLAGFVIIGLLTVAGARVHRRQADAMREWAQDLSQDNERLRKLTDVVPLIVWTARSDGTIDHFNHRMIEYSGVPLAQLLAGAWLDLLHPDDRERVARIWMESVRSGRMFQSEHRLRGSDGTYRWFICRAQPLRDREGRILCWSGSETDIHDRKLAEDRLWKLNQQLASADRHKDQFLAVLSHELRNPLAPIRNALFILDHGAPGGDAARRAQAVIRRQVEHLTHLVGDLLDVTRVTRGKVPLRRSRLDLSEVIGNAVEDHRPAFASHHVELRCQQPAEPVWVDGDATRLAQVVGNLLQNAAMFTPDGGQVRLSLVQEGPAAVIRVSDNGVGIPPDVLPQLFQPFVQADHTLERRSGGLGLGLALVKGLVELHGGEVQARSPGPDQGAEFTVRLPAEPAAAEACRPVGENPAPSASSP